MAASLIRRTGLLNAFSKLNRVQPLPRFLGSDKRRPFLIGAGKPTETASNFQSERFSRTLSRRWRGVRSGPDSILRRSARESIIFTLVPPMSTTRIFFKRVYDRLGPPLSESTSFRSGPASRPRLCEPGAIARENAIVLGSEANLQSDTAANSCRPVVARAL